MSDTETPGQRYDRLIADVDMLKKRAEEPQGQDPEPAPADPPVLTWPTPPQATKTVTGLRSDRPNNIRGKIRMGMGQVNLVEGPRDVVISSPAYIQRASIVFNGPSLRGSGRYNGSKFVEGFRGIGSECWIVNADLEGREIEGRIDTFVPVFGFDKHYCINSTIRKVRRAFNGCGWVEVYDSVVEDVWEDLCQGAGKIRNVTARRIGWPTMNPPTAHPDIIQCMGRWDVDGLIVEGYSGIGQGIALANESASGSVFKHGDFSGSGPGSGSGILIESKGGNGPSDILIEDWKMDKPFKVRTKGSDRWRGKNITLRRSEFSNDSFDELVIRDASEASKWAA